MAMKFEFFKDARGEWRWNAQSAGSIIFSSGEGFEKSQKAVQTVRKHIVREDEKLEVALVKALKKVGLNEKGGIDKNAKPTSGALEPAWPYPTPAGETGD